MSQYENDPAAVEPGQAELVELFTDATSVYVDAPTGERKTEYDETASAELVGGFHEICTL